MNKILFKNQTSGKLDFINSYKNIGYYHLYLTQNDEQTARKNNPNISDKSPAFPSGDRLGTKPG